MVVMERLRHQRHLPMRIQTDNGSELISIVMDRWACDHGVTMDYSRPGKPTDNPFIESLNGSFRDECLDTHWFLSLDDARQKIENWRADYNHFRAHSSDRRCPASRVRGPIHLTPQSRIFQFCSDLTREGGQWHFLGKSDEKNPFLTSANLRWGHQLASSLQRAHRDRCHEGP